MLAELELWPNLVRAARRSGARVAVINGRLSEHSFAGYRRIRPLAAALLRQIDLVAVQDDDLCRAIPGLGRRPESVHVTGSMKYDGAQTDRAIRPRGGWPRWPDSPRTTSCSWPAARRSPRKRWRWRSIRRLQPHWPKLRLVLVPRHPERFETVGRLLDASGVAWQRRSAAWSGPAPDPAARVLLVDVVGELGAWWGTAQIAFVGGSLGNRGGQNMIEPAAYGAAVCFGPNTRNFRDIVAAMLARDAAVVVADGDDLARFVRRCLEEPAYAAALGQRARNLVLEQLGATRPDLANC